MSTQEALHAPPRTYEVAAEASFYIPATGSPTRQRRTLKDGDTTFEIECPGTHGEYPKDDGRCFAIQFSDGGLS